MEHATIDAYRVDNPSITNATNTYANIDVDTNRADNPGRNTEGVISSNGNRNSETRCPKILNFSINMNIIGHDYSMQFTTEITKLKNLLRFK